MNKHDIIVIGGGHNGLTAAISLAKKGKKVLLLEKEQKLGGLAATGDTGFGSVLSDTSTIRSPIIKELGLERFGVQLTGSRTPVTLLGKDGQGLILNGNHEETANGIANFSKKDAEAYLKFRKFLNKITPLLSELMNEVPPGMKGLGIKDIWSLSKKAISLKRLGNEDMLELLRIAPMCVADYLNEWFETDFLKAGLAAPALYGSFTGPWSAGTNLNFLLYEALAKEEVVGGVTTLVSALEKAAIDSGVEIRLNTEVSEVVLENGVVKGVRAGGDIDEADVVLSSCSIKFTVLNLLPPVEVSHDIETQINNLRSRGTTAIVNLIYDSPVQFLYGNQDNAIYRTGNSFDEMEKAFDASKYRQYSENPMLEIRISSDKKSLNIMVHYAPFDIEGGWTDTKRDGLLANVKNELSLYIGGEAKIERSEIITPADIEARWGINGGHIFHAEHAIDQLITRPFPAFMQYKTSIPGLYNCGSSAHPGGGLTCAPGFLAASSL